MIARFYFSLIVSVAGMAVLGQAQPVPRLANGKPDLSGVWDHPRVGDMSKDVNGRCAGGTPGCSSIGAHDLDSLLTPFGRAENQKPNSNRLAVLFEQNNMFHVIPTDGRDHPKNLEPTWMGNSVGHWEGDTLVVDTIGFNGRTWLDTEPERLTSDQLHVIERIDRPDFQHLKYEITIDDPKMYTKPWKNTRTFVLMKPGEEILEYSCEENNKEIVEGHVTDAWTHK